MKTLVLIPAHNEQNSISDTIQSILSQTEKASKIVVIANGCNDATASIARSYKKVIVLDLPKLEHRKSEALNIAWNLFQKGMDMIVSMDADTVLPPNAIEDWKKEMSDPTLGGSSSKFTILKPKGLLPRMQKAEFSAWTDINLQAGYTTVLSGTGCAISNKVLKKIAKREDRQGPWAYTSQVEDFELTYRIQEAGYRTVVSPTVRAYTDSMKTVRSLWGQRTKWQIGTLEDLVRIGWNKHTRISWGRQFLSLLGVLSYIIWVIIISTVIITYQFKFEPLWLIIPVVSIIYRVRQAFRIPFHDKKDILLAASFFPAEAFNLFRYTLFIYGWFELIKSKITKKKKDRWEIQYKIEGE